MYQLNFFIISEFIFIFFFGRELKMMQRFKTFTALITIISTTVSKAYYILIFLDLFFIS